MGAVRWTRNGIRKPDDEIARLDDICLAKKQAMASPDETDRVQLDYDSQEKLDSLQHSPLLLRLPRFFHFCQIYAGQLFVDQPIEVAL